MKPDNNLNDDSNGVFSLEELRAGSVPSPQAQYARLAQIANMTPAARVVAVPIGSPIISAHNQGSAASPAPFATTTNYQPVSRLSFSGSHSPWQPTFGSLAMSAQSSTRSHDSRFSVASPAQVGVRIRTFQEPFAYENPPSDDESIYSVSGSSDSSEHKSPMTSGDLSQQTDNAALRTQSKLRPAERTSAWISNAFNSPSQRSTTSGQSVQLHVTGAKSSQAAYQNYTQGNWQDNSQVVRYQNSNQGSSQSHSQVHQYRTQGSSQMIHYHHNHGNSQLVNQSCNQSVGPIIGHSGNPQPGGQIIPRTTGAPAKRKGEFIPTTLALVGPGFHRAPTEEEFHLRMLSGMSPNYKGDPGNRFNHSANHLPDHENTAFWITKLPPDVEVLDILGQIHGCGRVFALHINKEKAHTLGAAAKLVFFTAIEAQLFAYLYMFPQTLNVRGWKAHIRRNRVKIQEQKGLGPNITRCLDVTGPRSLLEPEFLVKYLERNIEFQLEYIGFKSDADPLRCVLNMRFSSFRGQASLAYEVLTRNAIFVQVGVTVRHAPDPCAF